MGTRRSTHVVVFRLKCSRNAARQAMASNIIFSGNSADRQDRSATSCVFVLPTLRPQQLDDRVSDCSKEFNADKWPSCAFEKQKVCYKVCFSLKGSPTLATNSTPYDS